MGERKNMNKVPKLQFLPEDVLHKIGAYLNDGQLCRMELASGRIHKILSRPSATVLCKHPLNLLYIRPRTPEKARWLQRWLQRRILRYKHIKSYFSDYVLNSIDDLDGGTVPPLLPSLLATCAPSTELSLTVSSNGGRNFFNTLASASPQLDSFQAKLIQHLTELELKLDLGAHDAEDLESLAMLTALQRLEIGSFDKLSRLARKSVALKIPNLVFLELSAIKEGKLYLSCPRLEELHVVDSYFLHIRVEIAALNVLEVRDNEDVHIDLPADQLERLHTLHYGGPNMVDRHLIRDMRQMTRLQELDLEDCLAECLPSSYPQSLRKVSIQPWLWSQDSPRGLKDLCNLEDFSFMCTCKTWDITRPLEDFLPVHGLKCLQLGVDTFSPKEIRKIASEQKIRCRNPWWLTKEDLKRKV